MQKQLLPFDAWLEAIDQQQPAVLMTITEASSSQKNKRVCYLENQPSIGSFHDQVLEAAAKSIAQEKLGQSNPKPESLLLQDENKLDVGVFFDVFVPSPTLMVFGAGHDAIPVVKYAAECGMKTIVVDQRSLYNNEERFPHAERIIARPENFTECIRLTNRTYIVVMNHHIEKDKQTLKFALSSQAPYIGVLGPKSRRIKILDQLYLEGCHFTNQDLQRIHSPIGLDIGAVSSEEIAISIVAEVIAVRTRHKGGFLQGAEFIHQSP
ncbi:MULTISPECIES: XdhC family protein [Cytobacillus]|uniref:XdhC family protein n=1 Tax=Cytobacillus stercorigallinarum TaxID=2762240 RepID=A0ABR8QQJ3_9BACI|nr:XdhC family protein [Cytobacillus stercorigallinarum]MBD7937790.1 XdhC family protein [Cytobacillus stercorigallinarum]